MKNLNLNLFLIIGLIGLFIVGVITYSSLKNTQQQLLASLVQFETISQRNEEILLGNFGQCLAQKEIKLYGYSQDPATQKQKAILGKTFDYLPYIECFEPESKQLLFECQVEEIKIFPTWIFPQKERKVGILSLKKLEELSGCRF